VSIENAGVGGKGWSAYALGKNNDRKDALLIRGDTLLGDEICESLSYKSGNYARFVLSFSDEDNVSPQQGREIVKDWFDEFMHGFKDEEYHLDIVEHTDTDHLHYHARIPKLNLLTQTQLKPYYHKADLAFKIAVNEYIANKHGITVDSDKRRVIRPIEERQEQIQKWRTQHAQKPFTLKTKKERTITQEGLSDFISEMVQGGLINTLEEVVREIKELGFEVATEIDEQGNTVFKEGYDRGKEFYYLTINDEHNKMRIKGDIYGRAFYEHDREDRAEAIKNNRSIEPGTGESGRSREELERTLSAEREKRLKFIETQYGRAREKAYSYQNDRSLRFDNDHDKRNSTRDTAAYGSIEESHDRNTQRDVKRRETDTPKDAEFKPEVHTDTSQAMDHTHSDGIVSGLSTSSGDMGSDKTPKQRTSSITGVRRDDSSNQEDTRQIREKSMASLS
jgi:hypothetical protein